jgi:hypothetical protein
MKYLLPLLLAVLVCSCSARADGGAPVYDIQGSLTIPGTTPETINFNFDLTYSLTAFGTYNAYAIGGTASFTQSGPLGTPFSLFGGGSSNVALGNASPFVSYGSNYLGFFDPSGDEIDIYFSGNAGSTPGPPAVVGTYLYSCTSAACDANFCPPAYGCTAGQQSAALLIFGTAEDSAKKVPEPSAFTMLFAALAGLLLVAKRSTVARSLRLPSAFARNIAA